MKRSHAIALGATGIILAGAWLGSGKNEAATDAAIYGDVNECIRAGALNREQCEAQFAEAEKSHISAAPKFANAGECETQYGAGQCKPASFNGASVFVPAMVGVLVANYLTNRRQPQALLPQQNGIPVCPPGVTPAMQPGCVAPRQGSTTSSSSSSSSSGWRSYSTAAGHTISRDTSAGQTRVQVPTQAAVAPAARTSLGAVAPRTSNVTSTHSPSSGATSNTVSRGGFGSTARSTSSSSSS